MKTLIEKPLTSGEVLTNFPTNTQVFAKVELNKLINATNFKDGSAECWTVLIDDNYRTEMWIPVSYNPMSEENRTAEEKGWI